MSNQAVEIEILGKKTKVNCPLGQQQALIQAAKDLNYRLTEMAGRTNVNNSETLLTIAALNVCYELQELKKQQLDNQHLQNQYDALTKRMESLTLSLSDVLNKMAHE